MLLLVVILKQSEFLLHKSRFEVNFRHLKQDYAILSLQHNAYLFLNEDSNTVLRSMLGLLRRLSKSIHIFFCNENCSLNKSIPHLRNYNYYCSKSFWSEEIIMMFSGAWLCNSCCILFYVFLENKVWILMPALLDQHTVNWLPVQPCKQFPDESTEKRKQFSYIHDLTLVVKTNTNMLSHTFSELLLIKWKSRSNT